MENNSGEKSLVDEINLNWNSLPIKYDNFMEMYAAKEDEQSEQEIINKVIIYFLLFWSYLYSKSKYFSTERTSKCLQTRFDIQTSTSWQ